MKVIKLITITVVIGIITNLVLSSNLTVSAGPHECGWPCQTDNDCPYSQFGQDPSRPRGATGAYRSICHPTRKICVSPLCPDQSNLDAQCACNVSIGRCGDRCGIWSNGFYPLCGDGVSSCSWINGPFCQQGANSNTFCMPITPQNGYTSRQCSNDPTYKYLVRPNGTTGSNTQADVVAACNCSPLSPGAATLYTPGNGQIFTTTTSATVTFAYDLNSSGWGRGCPMRYDSSMFVRVNGGNYVEYRNAYGLNSNTHQLTFPTNSFVEWFVRKHNGSAFTDSPVVNFRVQPPCSQSAPGVAALTSPANNANVTLGVGNSVPLSYDVNSSGWGTGCPTNNNSYTVQVSPNCTGAYINYGAVNSLPNLTRGTTYCWRVQKSNGSLTSLSSVFRFTVIDDSTEVTTSGIQADVCGGGFSGQAGSPLVTNPVDFRLNFTTLPGNTFVEAWVAIVPANDPFNSQSGIPAQVTSNIEVGQTQTEALLLPKVNGARAFAAKIVLDAAGNPSAARVYTGSGWASTIDAGNLQGLGGTLMGFRSTSTAQASGTNLTSRFTIRLDNSFPLGKFSYFVAALFRDPEGRLKTSYSTPQSSFVYRKVNAMGSLVNWGVDTVPPAPLGFGTATYTTPSQFRINWQFNEINGLRLKSFVTSDIDDSALRDLSAGSYIDLGMEIPNTANYNNGSITFDSINPWNGFVTEASLGQREYQDDDPTKQSNYLFYAFTRDSACNQRGISATAFLQRPWLIGYNGDVSAGDGIIGISVPNGLNELADDLRAAPSIPQPLLTDKLSVFLSSFSSISGTADMPLRKQSKTSQYLTRYDDLSTKPPLDSGYGNWFTYIYEVVKKNNAAPITTIAGDAVLTGEASNFLGVSPGAKAHVLINGTLRVENATCNTKTIFFVRGDTATVLDSDYPNAVVEITPNFTANNATNGCIFVVTRDILIENGGTQASGPLDVNDSALARYDYIEAAFFTDGQLITKLDRLNTSTKGDGLMIKGSVTSDDLFLQRDINLNANQLQPAHVFYYDARYREVFKQDLNYDKYSIREIGFTNN